MKGLIDQTRLEECSGVVSTPCVDSLTLEFSNFCKDKGFTWMSFAQRPMDRHGDANTAFFYATTFPQEWIELYVELDYAQLDPVVRCAEFSSPLYGAFGTWNEVLSLCIDDPIGANQDEHRLYEQKLRQLYRDAARFGMQDGVIIVEEVEGTLVTVSMASENPVSLSDSEWRELKVGILLAAREFDKTKGCNQCGRGFDHLTLSRMESLMVATVLDNKSATIDELAYITNRSPETVKHHLKNVRAKVNMKHTNRLAVARRCEELRIIKASA